MIPFRISFKYSWYVRPKRRPIQRPPLNGGLPTMASQPRASCANAYGNSNGQSNKLQILLVCQAETAPDPTPTAERRIADDGIEATRLMRERFGKLQRPME